MSVLIHQIQKHLLELKKLCGFGKKSIKESITKATQHLEESKELINFEVIADPFFEALSTDFNKFLIINLEFFNTIFAYSNSKNFPNSTLINKILDLILKIPVQGSSEEIQLNLCKVLSSCLKSEEIQVFLHGKKLSEAFLYLLNSHSECSGSVREVIAMTIQETYRQIVLNFTVQAPEVQEFQSIEELAKYTAERIISNVLLAFQLQDDNQESDDYNNDISLITSLFARIISIGASYLIQTEHKTLHTNNNNHNNNKTNNTPSNNSKSNNNKSNNNKSNSNNNNKSNSNNNNNKSNSNNNNKSNNNKNNENNILSAKSNFHYSANTIELCCNSLLILFQTKSNFLQTSTFSDILHSHLHKGLLSLILVGQRSLLKCTVDLIFNIWDFCAPIYVDGLAEILDRGLCIALTSPYPNVLDKSHRIIASIAMQPQFFVDCFVNYDCDHSGTFNDIFEKLFTLLSKNILPGLICQNSALAALVISLEMLNK